ncbi:MAG: thioesterase family protein [Paracoccaceae bacterium]|nr:thioesterase family protein [Paracoccaceae bacterium]
MAETEIAYEKAPIRTTTRHVPPEWIDYNGHMNVAYYTMAFDQAADEIFEGVLKIGENLVREHRMGPMALQTQIHYLGELLEGGAFHCEFQVLDADPKRVHFFMTMINGETGQPAATYESLTMNVDLEARRSAPYPDAAQERIQRLTAAHAGLPRPAQAGNRLGIRSNT